MKYVYVFLAGGAVVILLSWLGTGDSGVFEWTDGLGHQIRDWLRGKPSYCFEPETGEELKRAMDDLVRDHNAGKDVIAICED